MIINALLTFSFPLIVGAGFGLTLYWICYWIWEPGSHAGPTHNPEIDQ